jgi:ribosome-binding ATPase YchF (GTP1/OBG family)
VKIAALGLEGFPQGKVKVPDERIKKLEQMFHPPKTTYLQLEFLGEEELPKAEGILAQESKRLDLIIQDLEYIEQRLNKEIPQAQRKLLLKCKQALDNEQFLSSVELVPEERRFLEELPLLSLRPVYLAGPDSSLEELIRRSYDMLGYICFFTVNEKELRAWPIKKGTTALEAAGLIHSDIKKGFIRAEVIGFGELIAAGGINQARQLGYLRLEGKDYIVGDGDLIKFRFSP